MQYSFVAAATGLLVASANGALLNSYVAPSSAPAYYSTPVAPVYSAPPAPYSSAPAVYSTPSAPVYSAPAKSSSVPVYHPVPVYTTEVVTAITTYCPSATQITHGTKTYTVTSATTLTITDCPCTVTKSSIPSSYPVSSAKTSVAPPPVYTSAVSTGAVYSSAPSAPVYTVPVTSKAPSAPVYTVPASTPAATPTSARPSQYTGAASNLAPAGALAGVAGLLAFIL